MKRLILAIVLLLAVASTGLAAENLTGLATDGKNVVVKDGLAFTPTVVTANATVLDRSFIQINRAANATATIDFTPAIGQWFTVTQTDAHVATATVLLPSGLTWNGTNRGATFNAAAETLVGFRASATRIVILENLGTVGFSN